MALRLFEAFEPSAIVGFGGYPALPALLAAGSAGLPSVIHEQNAVLGRVNRLLAGRVEAIATSYAKVDRLKPEHAPKAHLTGNPVRGSGAGLARSGFSRLHRRRAAAGAGHRRQPGRAGVVRSGPRWPRHAPAPALRQKVAGNPAMPRGRSRLPSASAMPSMIFPPSWAPISRNMHERLADAHLFIGRAGASTIARTHRRGPSGPILIPLPIATDDHQAANTPRDGEGRRGADDPAGRVPAQGTRQADSGDGDEPPPASPTLRTAPSIADGPMRRRTWPIWSRA